jgi:cytochrome c556
MLKRIMLGGALVMSAGVWFTASAQQTPPPPPTPEELATSATATRQGLFKLLGHNMGQISGMARGTVEFDAAIAERNANRIAMLAPMIPELFERDTRQFNVTTEALPIIWEQKDEFAEKARNLIAAAETFAEVARGGDQRAITAAIRPFGAACGNCHQTFRVD